MAGRGLFTERTDHGQLGTLVVLGVATVPRRIVGRLAIEMDGLARLNDTTIGSDQLKNVLAVGAHPDDIEHGAGGLLLRAKANGVKTFMLVLTNGANNGHVEERRHETRAAAEKLGAELIWMGLPDGTLQADRPTIAVVETHIHDLDIGTIAVHAPEDSHQDHRAATQVVLSAGRQTSNVLFYRSPSTLRFDPTVFVNIEEFVDRKVEALSCHDSQVRGSLMIEPDVLPGLARYDGMQARLGWAEGFMPLRMELVP